MAGSEAMDAAMKLARQYYLELSEPQPQRTRFIARKESYHGNTLGSLSLGGHVGRRALYEPMLLENVSHVSACNAYRGKIEGEDDAAYVQRLAKELDDEFQRVGPDTVCAFVAEPIVGAVCVLVRLIISTDHLAYSSTGPRLCPGCSRLFQSREGGL
jgi:adenosylmethionine-8-amino-7-oxononanoate aminotransferase